MRGEENIGLGPDTAADMERQGSRMQVDEDSRNARYQTDTFRMLGYKASPQSTGGLRLRTKQSKQHS